ncbi:uncharacterized protein [Rutidosis leptorrhynchoides]|uniref:uncharacterized protein n=1 Tax=Rutidosis leptorrhynchoides TaxID=125765 RepID=UPI003A9A5A74
MDNEWEYGEEEQAFMSEEMAGKVVERILTKTAPGDEAVKPPAMAESTQCFITRIAEYPLPRNLGIPSIGVYDGTTDPEDFLTMFEGVMRLQHCEEEVTCHMFPMVLHKMAREWFASLLLRSIISFLDLRAKFVMQYQSLRSCTLSHLDAHEITMHQNESLSNFMKRYTVECQKIPDIPESAFHALRYDVSKTLHQALVVAQKHLRAGEMGHQRVERNYRHENGGRHQKKSCSLNPSKKLSILQRLWRREKAQRVTDDVIFMKHMHTDNCKSLMREIIAKIKAGELNHLLPGKQGKKIERDPTPERHIKVIWNGGEEQEVSRERNTEAWMYALIMFHTIPNLQLSKDPVVISNVIANKFISKIYTDTSNEEDLLYLYCFRCFSFSVKDRLRNTDIKITSITRASVRAVGKVKLDVTLGTYPLVRTEIVDFTVLDGKSRFNALLGRRTLRKFGAIYSTSHAELRFPTPNGKSVVHYEYMGPARERSIVYEAERDMFKGGVSKQLFNRNEVNGYFKVSKIMKH